MALNEAERTTYGYEETEQLEAPRAGGERGFSSAGDYFRV